MNAVRQYEAIQSTARSEFRANASRPRFHLVASPPPPKIPNGDGRFGAIFIYVLMPIVVAIVAALRITGAV